MINAGSSVPMSGNNELNNGENDQKLTLTDYVGFDLIVSQIRKRLVKSGFVFNIMLVGCSGLGKTTLINTLFATRILESSIKWADTRKTVAISKITNVIEENGVQLTLNIIDTPGFGDQLNNESCCDPIIKYIKDQYSSYLRKELMPTRDKAVYDSRIHAVIYFISPTGHSLSLLDLMTMKKLSGIVNLIPIIAKADVLTLEERASFKRRIRAEMKYHEIPFYPYPEVERETDGSQSANSDIALPSEIRKLIPFAIIGSERNVIVNGKAVRGRRTKWGIVDIENVEHCEFVIMRDFIIRSNMDNLIQWTATHYESYRKRQLTALRESARMTSKQVSHNGNINSEGDELNSESPNQHNQSNMQSLSSNSRPTPTPSLTS